MIEPREDVFVSFYKRDLSGTRLFPPTDFRVEQYSKGVLGGALECDITAFGRAEDVLDLYNLLRCPVEVYDQQGVVLWVGYVETVEPRGILAGASITDMANHITALYTSITADNPTGGQTEEVTVSDATSITAFGQKELRTSIGTATASAAQSRTNNLLAERKYPLAALNLSKIERPTSAKIRCVGWFKALEWRYYSNSVYKTGFEAQGNLNYTWIYDTGEERVAQSFKNDSGQALTIGEIALKIGRAESASSSGNLYVELCSDSGGSPNTVLATSANVAVSGITQDTFWRTFSFSSPYTISSSGAVTYWIVLRRSGGLDPTKQVYIKARDDAAYTDGAAKYYTGAAWTTITDVDFKFRAVATTQTTTQISTMIGTITLLAGAQIDNASGVYSSPYRNGERTVHDEVVALLEQGTTSDRRLLCEVTPARKIRVYEEYAKASAYRLGADGELLDSNGVNIPARYCAVGRWVSLRDVVPTSVALDTIIRPDLFFIERAEYNARTGRTTYTPRAFSRTNDISVRAT